MARLKLIFRHLRKRTKQNPKNGTGNIVTVRGAPILSFVQTQRAGVSLIPVTCGLGVVLKCWITAVKTSLLQGYRSFCIQCNLRQIHGDSIMELFFTHVSHWTLYSTPLFPRAVYVLTRLHTSVCRVSTRYILDMSA